MMIKKTSKYILLILILFQFSLSADEVKFQGDLNSSMNVVENRKFYYTSDFEKTNKIFYLGYKNIDGVPFFINEIGEKWLILKSNEICFIYTSEDIRPFFWGVNPEKINSTELIVFPFLWQATSYFREKDKTYLPGNIGKTQLEMPWVEGVEGSGCGEKISLEKPILMKNIYLSNGYVSYTRPYLYKDNNRVKALKITDLLDLDFIINIELDDTPNPQKINLGEEKVRQLQFEIQDVYKGEKWDDTCINFILVEL